MLTIVIFTGGRYNYLYQLLNDLSKLKISILIVDFNEKKIQQKEYRDIKKNKIKLIWYTIYTFYIFYFLFMTPGIA